jgi:anti-anti-sigma factor
MDSTARFERRAGRIHVIGDLDLASAPLLDAEVAALDGEPAVVDLSRLEFIDSSGIHALTRARMARPDLTIVEVPEQARRVIELAGLTQHLLAPGVREG